MKTVNSMFRELGKILKITGGKLKFITLLILRAPFDAAWNTIQAAFLLFAFNAVETGNRAALGGACLFFGIAVLCAFLYNGTVWSVYAPFVTRREAKLHVKLFEKISSLSYERVEASPPGDWLTRLNTDVQSAFLSQPLQLPHLVNAALRAGISAAALWIISPQILGLVVIFVVPHILFNQLFVARAMPKLNKRALEVNGANTDCLNAVITCADISALYGGEEFLMERFERTSRELFRAKMKMHFKKAVSDGVVPLFGLGGYLTLLIICAGRIADGSMGFGDLVAAFQYRGGGLIWGTNMFIACVTNIGAGMAGLRRINEVMDEPQK